MADGKAGFIAKVRKRAASFLISFSIVGVCAGLLLSHYKDSHDGSDFISSMENKLLDLRFRLRGARQPTGKVGILAIDEKALVKFGQWPIARTYYAQIFKNLKTLGAEWLGFDVMWSEPERPLLQDVKKSVERLKTGDAQARDEELAIITDAMKLSLGDRSLGKAIKEYGKIVMGYAYYSKKSEAASLGSEPFSGLDGMAGSAIIPDLVMLPKGRELKEYRNFRSWGIAANIEPIAKQAEHFGYFNNELSNDAIFRWVQLVREMNGSLMPALSLKMASQIMNRVAIVGFDDIGVNEITLMNPDNDQDLIKIPVDLVGRGRVLLNHLGPRMTIPHFSMADVYDMTLTAEQKKQIKGMNLLMGPTALGINDLRANPFDAGFDGVEQHAAAIDNILGGNFMRRTDTVYARELGLILGIGLLFSPLMIFGRAVFSGVAAVLFLAGYFLFDKYFWFNRGEWVYMGMPFIEIFGLYGGVTLYKYMTEERERKKVKGAFGLYLSPEVMNEVLEDPAALKLGGERKELTVFFSDVRGFTTISEHLSPEKLGELMNEYFTPMADIIQKTNGVLDKYIGDAIMAFWGAPLKMPNPAEVATLASIDMLYALDRVRAEFQRKGFPSVDIGIGLNTGMMSVGNFGSPQRFCYTVMGDSVNLGARLEGLTKEYGIKIMISEFTQSRITNKSILLRDLDDIKVKGKKEPVRVYEVIRPDAMKSEAAIRSLIGEFELGRAAYRAQKWDLAEKHFVACLQIRPDDGPAGYYLRYMEEEELKTKPFDEQWDAVREFKHK